MFDLAGGFTYGGVNSIILVLLAISVVLNIVLYAKILSLNRTLSNVDRGVEITKEELVHIRRRLEELKGEFKEGV